MTVYDREEFVKPQGRIIAIIPKDKVNLYRMNCHPNDVKGITPPIIESSFVSSTSSVSEDLMHQRLGHLNRRDVYSMMKHSANGLRIKRGRLTEGHCEGYIMGNKLSPFYRQHQTYYASRRVGLLRHRGFFPTEGMGGSRYFYTFIDHKTRFVKVYLLKRKHEWLNALRAYESAMIARFGMKIETLQTDNAGEMCKIDPKTIARFAIYDCKPRKSVANSAGRPPRKFQVCVMDRLDQYITSSIRFYRSPAYSI